MVTSLEKKIYRLKELQETTSTQYDYDLLGECISTLERPTAPVEVNKYLQELNEYYECECARLTLENIEQAEKLQNVVKMIRQKRDNFCELGYFSDDVKHGMNIALMVILGEIR